MSHAKVYDGHTVVFGMDADTEPTELPSRNVHKAVNRVFRGGKNKTRPVYREIKLTFNNDEERDVFLYGNMQGAYPYLKVRPGRRDGLVVSVAGQIFFVSLVNEKGHVTRIFVGNDPKLMHAWFCQAEEWIYIQNGKQLPVFWNGLLNTPARRSLGLAKQEMPIGTIMCYAHGRVFVSNAFNQIAASDVMFGRGNTNSRNVQKFTENKYWSEGGYFTFPLTLGRISGMIVLPQMSVNLRGQGELLVLGMSGAMSFDVSLPREQWKDAQIQRTSMVGVGCRAPESVVGVNGDAWFRSSEGWSSYSATRIDLAQKMGLHKMSREVNYWLDQDTDHLIRFASNIFFDNRILGTVSPQLSLTRNPVHGSHRYFRGIIALDLDPTSGMMGSEQINFDGLWTGVRPTALVKLETRAFAFSYDADGQNRIYEITKAAGNDNGNKKIRSHYVSKRFASTPSGSSEFQTKRIVGGELWLSGIKDAIAAKVSYRSDNSPCWQDFGGRLSYGCNKVKGPLPFTKPRFKRWRLGTPDPDLCQPGSDNLSSSGTLHQYLIELEGDVRVDRFRVASEVQPDAELQGDCPEEETECDCEPITCRSENDFEYLIVEPNG